MRTLPSWHTTLAPAGPQAAHIDFLWWLFLWVSVAVYGVVMVFLLAALIRNRPGDPGTAASHRAGRVVVAAVALTTGTLFGLLIASAVKGHAISLLRAPDGLKIQLIGHQWWWEVIYADPTPSQQVTTANEIHIPVGRPVQFHLTSGDVIHSFWVPNLHGKTDLMPGKVTTTWLRADKAGTYRGQCAEFCGFQHAHMALFVIAEPKEQFDTWYSQQLKPAPQPSGDTQKRGREVFLTQPCVMCHSIRGTDAGARYGPDLTHLASRRTIAAGTLPFSRGHLAGWITDSQSVKPGNNMPPVPLRPADLQSLLSYLETLK
jgi:cytochrome c oxidase subunit II